MSKSDYRDWDYQDLQDKQREYERGFIDGMQTMSQRKPWVGLTDDEIDLFINGRGDEDDEDYVEPTGDGFGLTDADLVQLVRRSESKLKEKNTFLTEGESK